MSGLRNKIDVLRSFLTLAKRNRNDGFERYLLIFTLVTLVPNLCWAQLEFVKIPAGTYVLGKKSHGLNKEHKVLLKEFSISITEITNAEFERFVIATNYRTDAEKRHNAMVFEPGLREFEWMEDSTAYWRFPNGVSRGGIENKMNHPVTCISYRDAQAYCKWAGYRLPTLDEWEAAARANTTTDFFFGANNQHIHQYANIWKGEDHLKADSTDEFVYTAPVKSFAPNAFGLYDMYGNVFEFCSGEPFGATSKPGVVHARGGSWWCSIHSCGFFNSVDIGRVASIASFSNQGFRVVRQ
jgi:formylglycine-generating enzyme